MHLVFCFQTSDTLCEIISILFCCFTQQNVWSVLHFCFGSSSGSNLWLPWLVFLVCRHPDWQRPLSQTADHQDLHQRRRTAGDWVQNPRQIQRSVHSIRSGHSWLRSRKSPHFVAFGSENIQQICVLLLWTNSWRATESFSVKQTVFSARKKSISLSNAASIFSFLSRSVCPWTPHSTGPQVPPDGSRPPRRHRVWHSAAVERSNLWLSVPAVEGYQLLQQVSHFTHRPEGAQEDFCSRWLQIFHHTSILEFSWMGIMRMSC